MWVTFTHENLLCNPRISLRTSTIKQQAERWFYPLKAYFWHRRSARVQTENIRMKSVYFVVVLSYVLSAFLYVGGESNDYDGQRCAITSVSREGLGHQLAGRLACIAVAEDLAFTGMEYVHTPMVKIGHIHDIETVKVIEEFLNIGMKFRVNRRDVVPQVEFHARSIVEKCGLETWFDRIARKKFTCDPNVVYYYGDCWDQFTCNTTVTGKGWYDALPKVQAGYAEGKRMPMQKLLREEVNVVLHVRQGDAQSRKVPVEVFLSIMKAVLHHHIEHYRYQKLSPVPHLHFYVHSDGPIDQRHREYLATDIEQQRGLGIPQRGGDEPGKNAEDGKESGAGEVRVEIFDNGEDNLELLSLHHFVCADLLIGSRSAFSLAPAMIGNQSAAFPAGLWGTVPELGHRLLPHMQLFDKDTGEMDLHRFPWPPRSPISDIYPSLC